MTSKQIRKLRGQLQLDPFAFAGVLGVHVSTVYRWESSPGDVNMGPLQAQIMDRMRELVTENPEAAAAMRAAIVKGLLTGGPLFGLLALLKQLLEELRD